ncbi:MAG: class I SAM-dependent methyltransferase, partial [Pseudomonadota bacterium]|nr:class I SAM-dependent methyltransferase [Pseudomonadota bacterium]
MSRLDSAIRRLQAQRECLDCAAKRIASKPGIVLEIGLGNGRTYDHLRSRLPGREIYVFDRQAAPHPFCLPEEQYLVLGDLYATLPEFLGRRAGQVVLVHCDIGSGQPAITDP